MPHMPQGAEKATRDDGKGIDLLPITLILLGNLCVSNPFFVSIMG